MAGKVNSFNKDSLWKWRRYGIASAYSSSHTSVPGAWWGACCASLGQGCVGLGTTQCTTQCVGQGRVAVVLPPLISRPRPNPHQPSYKQSKVRFCYLLHKSLLFQCDICGLPVKLCNVLLLCLSCIWIGRCLCNVHLQSAIQCIARATCASKAQQQDAFAVCRTFPKSHPRCGTTSCCEEYQIICPIQQLTSETVLLQTVRYQQISIPNCKVKADQWDAFYMLMPDIPQPHIQDMQHLPEV